MNLATHLVHNLQLAEHAAFVGAEALHMDLAFDFVEGDLLAHMEDTVLKMQEDYELARQALYDALTDTLTPANAMLHTVRLVWEKRIAEADDYFND